MKDIKQKVKSKSFWMTMAAALIMILKALGLEMGAEGDRIADAVCGILVTAGILTSPSKKETGETSQHSCENDND